MSDPTRPDIPALRRDVAAAQARVQAQLEADPTHEVALAMYRKDLRRAEQALQAALLMQPGVRRYSEGRRVA